jgi:polysaccharide pyruvyl transferase WcaK-like protein
VVIPGMGIFESSLPVRPWGLPSALFVAGLAGRIFGTKVAYISVGAGMINQRITRLLFYWAARLAFYRSYRDVDSREAMRRWGLDTAGDPVYPDLAFTLPVPPSGPGDPSIVCVGVMDYHGSSDDRKHADEILRSYVSETKRFVQGLLTDGRSVRLLVGDTNGSDGEVAEEILVDLRQAMPDLDPSRLVVQPVISLADIMVAMAPAGSVVAIRFHNVVAALMLAKPTIAIGYGPKHDSLMAESGVPEFCQPVKTLDHDQLASKFMELENRAPELRHLLAERKALCDKLLSEQYARLSITLFSPRNRVVPQSEYELARGDVV